MIASSMASDVNPVALAAALRRMGSLATLDPRAMECLAELVRTGAEAKLYLINPLRLAREEGVPEAAMVDACVAGSRAGLLQFTWTMTCPGCGMYSTQMPRLHDVHPTSYCAVCDMENPAILDTLISVAFTVDRGVRSLVRLSSGALTPTERFGLYHNRDAIVLMPMPEARNMLKWSAVVPALGTDTSAVAEPLSIGRLIAISHERALRLAPPEGYHGAAVRLHEDRLELVEYLREPVLKVDNQTRNEAVIGLVIDGPPPEASSDMAARACAGVKFAPVLTGKMLLCNQLFRDLFGAETLSAGIALQIENLTLLFTDLKGSTALYDAIGDVKAFSLVSEHFKILLAVIKENQGAVVKTIGDAVMAAFADSRTAMQAALAMAARIRSFNVGSGLPPLSLKVGMHAGPCIVVNSNERLDYFGQTVNVAARVQGLADGDEIVTSDVCFRALGVPELLAPLSEQLQVQGSMASLKGVGEQLKVHTLRPTIR